MPPGVPEDVSLFLLDRRFRLVHCIAVSSVLIFVSNLFELAVDAAIVLFGFDPGAELANVVGVLV